MNDWLSEGGTADDDRPVVIHDGMLAAEEEPAGRIDFERGMSQRPALTIVLILACVGAFAWELAGGALDSRDALIRAGALDRQRVLDGQWWRLLSAAFLHGGFDHLLGNCLVLYIVGMACEHAFGWRRAGLIYVASALGGSLLSVAMQPGPSIGASGAVFGIAGAMVAFFYRHHRSVVLRDGRIGFVLLVWALYQIGTGFFTPWIDNFAHIGGFLTGAAMSLLLSPALLAPRESDEYAVSGY